MASTLRVTIDLGREEVVDLIEKVLKEKNCQEVEITLGHISENGQHVQIHGEKPCLLELQAGFKEHNQIAVVD